MANEYDPATQYPLCTVMGDDGNEFRESELRDMVTGWCNKTLSVAQQVRQIEIKHKLDKGEELTVDDINDCKMLRDLPGEEWKRCVVWTHYFVSNLGRVKSSGETQYDKIGRPYTFKAVIMAGIDSYSHYLMVYLSGGKFVKKNHSVHRLIAEAWIPKTEEDIRLGRDQVNHMNANKHDNRVVNLEWVTNLENQFHARELGLFDYEVVNKDLARKVREDYNNGMYKVDIAKKYGIRLANLNVMLFNDVRWPDLPKTIIHAKKSNCGTVRASRKLTVDQALELRVRVAHGEHCLPLSKEYGISRNAAYSLVHGETYKNALMEDHPDKVKMIEKKFNYS